MRVGDTVFQNYGGLHRYGKVKQVKENLKGDGWSWAKIDWVDDEKFIASQKWKAEMRNEDENHFIPEYYRCDDVQTINLNKTLKTLVKLKERS
tara:strand:- start:409 stop:687 length:279 start_codon:yes stop_codon:yes gene_type:complete